ncbi:conjugal transfer protein TraN [Sphingomonas sp. CCH18-B1]|uniref:conjugal transfer protein TraN n=1 Tax=Sphingomonas sp. CCH18-B1 TaxID=1768744 RepID=UPI0009E9889D|nr:conjugal transfer protein TraN [Sphingomonas sp. CCH18-B1]
MRVGLASILAGAACFALTLPSALLAQSAQSAPGGGYYDLDDYTYFPQPQPQRNPLEPIMPVLPDDPIAPVFPIDPQPAPAPTPTPAPTPAPSPGSPPPSGGGGGGSVPVAPYVPGGPLTFPMGDINAAKADGKAFVTDARAANRQITTSTNLTGTIPGYTGQRLPEEALADDPDRLTSQGASGALGNDAWRLVTNPDRTTVTLDRDGLLRAQAVQEDPDAYLAGSSLGAANAQCQPLPPSGAGTEYYEATCEQGAQPIDEARTCRVPLVIQADGSQYWEYSCYSDEPQPGHAGICAYIESALQGGGCTLIDRERIGFSCLQWVYDERGGRPWCAEPGDPNFREVWSCPAQLPGVRGGFLRNTTRIVSETRDEGMCQVATDGLTCTQSGEVCTGQPETRTINGLAVTRSCWEWERTYQCSGTTQATDCGDIEGNTQCTFLREECLDDPQVGACQVATRVYRCPIPGGGTTDPAQYICGDDVYCIDGECEPIEREASTEFKDALVGLHTLGQANAEFNEADFTLFSGTRETCTKKVFGLSNCCSGKGVPLLTPFLCPAAERELDKKDDKGLCHRVGTYCSDKVLGVCVTRKDAYCCFESKLSRILQQQGRQQIGKRWGEPKRETCKGFTLEEFSRLDLSVMNFTEVYADFLDAAKVPDELDTSRQIQQRIEDYLQQNGRP